MYGHVLYGMAELARLGVVGTTHLFTLYTCEPAHITLSPIHLVSYPTIAHVISV